MPDFNLVAEFTPTLREHLRNEATVAPLGVGFRTEQRRLSGEILRQDLPQRVSLFHQFQERPFIVHPVAGLSVGVANLRAGGQERLMFVRYSKDSVEEKGKIRVLRESRKLSASILANIHDLLDASLLEKPKEFFSSFLGKANRKER
jgi:hypothetical protein